MSDLEESHFEPDNEEDCLPDHIKGSTLGKREKSVLFVVQGLLM